MIPPSAPVTEADIDRLDAFLMSENVADDAMTISMLDGFLTGIVIGPELILPSEWMPLIWGSAPPEFKTASEAQDIYGLIMRCYNQIITDLTHYRDDYEPILTIDHTGDLLGEIWADGFLMAMRLREDAWKPIFDSEYGTAASLIMTLAIPEMMDELTDGFDEASNLANALSEDLPVTVLAIDDFWKSRRGQPSEAIRTGTKTGRNEPCPCGSGKKYKKCCLLH